MLVDGQWDVTTKEALLNQSFWILCSEADMRVPAQNDKAMDNLEKLGARISRARWYENATKDDMKRNAEHDKMYVKFVNHTVMPDDIPYDPANEHIYTWKVAYLIDSLRDRLFSN